ncbi:unnamed protein product [Coregonus sp. 'balchen']|nr:unnamed protein product [Coregonus sp. 'balchen']
MQPEAKDPEEDSVWEEPPSMLWGLDPMFNAFTRLYVKDILQMRDLCWKDKQWRDQCKYRYSHSNCVCQPCSYSLLTVSSSAGARSLGSSARGDFNPANELKKLRQAQHSSSHLEIGELLRISWMMEVPQLYRQCYDKPFQLDGSAQNPNIKGGSASYLLGRATRILKDFLKEKDVTRFRPYDEPEAGPSSGPSTSFKQLRELLQKSLQILEDEGLVFRKVKSQDEVYHVTEQDKDLLMAIRDILREDCRREKYAEKGCHILHVLSSVRQRYSRNVSKAALELVLKALECNSDIISTSDTLSKKLRAMRSNME